MEALFHLVSDRGNWISILVLVALLAWETSAPFFGFFRKHAKDRTLHAFRNILLGVLNGLMIALLFVALWLWAAELAYEKQVGILYWIPLPAWAQALGALLLFDFWTYWWHRFNHTIPFLWRFHRVHHSDNHMDVTTSHRFHFGEIFLSSTLRIALILLFGAKLWHLAFYESIMFPIVLMHHANISIPKGADKLLRVFIVSPDMHKVHHSRIQLETDSNFTSMLSIWDRLFRSFRMRDELHDIEFGLEHYDGPDKQSVTGMLKTPIDRRKSD